MKWLEDLPNLPKALLAEQDPFVVVEERGQRRGSRSRTAGDEQVTNFVRAAGAASVGTPCAALWISAAMRSSSPAIRCEVAASGPSGRPASASSTRLVWHPRRQRARTHLLRIGLVSFWFNRGQAIVARHLRGALESLGHETFVLARPTKKSFYRPGYVEAHDVWAQPRVTAASHFNIPWREYERWAIDHDLRGGLLRPELPVRRDRASPRHGGRHVWAVRLGGVPAMRRRGCSKGI